MGRIDISVIGSFRPSAMKSFFAQQHGHAHATRQAIAWLQEVILPAAETQDASLYAEGVKPKDGFLPEDLERMGKSNGQ